MTFTCIKCGKNKSFDSFPPRKDSKFGIRHSCKVCNEKYQKKYRKTHKEALNIQKRAYIKRNYKKQKAHWTISNMVKRGKLERIFTKECYCCNKQAEEYHHPDYSKPKDVIPVCIPCHRYIHTEVHY